MKICITMALLFFLASANASSLTLQGETSLNAGMNCYESDDLTCAMEHFENALSLQDSGMNIGQRHAIEKILYSIYFTLALEKSNLGLFDDIGEICDKGIALGVGMGRTNDDAFKSFHVWYTISLIHNTGMKDALGLAYKLQQIQRELTSSASDGRVSYMQSHSNPKTIKSRL